MIKLQSWFFIAAAIFWSITTPAVSSDQDWLAAMRHGFLQAIQQTANQHERNWHHAVQTVRALPEPMRNVAAAATVSGEGHWTFSNGKGELFTAANRREMASMTDALFPDGVGPAGLTLYLTPAAVFLHHDQLEHLPAGSHLRLVTAEQSYPLQAHKSRSSRNAKLVIRVRPGVIVEPSNRKIFEELIWQLERPLMRHKIRMLSIVDGGPDVLPAQRSSRFDTGDLQTDSISPQHLLAVLPSLSEQIAVLTGRVQDNDLIIRTQSGREIPLDLQAIRRITARHDVGLILLNSQAPRQPGARNWLFLRVGVNGLTEALNRETFADFIASLALSTSMVEVRGEISPDHYRVRLLITPASTGSAGSFVGFIAELASEVTATVLPATLELDMPSRSRSQELSWRFISGVPALIQAVAAALLLLSLLTVKVSWRWWNSLWPPEDREDYGSWFGYQAARTARLIAFTALFLPIAGLPVLIWQVSRTFYKRGPPTTIQT